MWRGSDIKLDSWSCGLSSAGAWPLKLGETGTSDGAAVGAKKTNRKQLIRRLPTCAEPACPLRSPLLQIQWIHTYMVYLLYSSALQSLSHGQASRWCALLALAGSGIVFLGSWERLLHDSLMGVDRQRGRPPRCIRPIANPSSAAPLSQTYRSLVPFLGPRPLPHTIKPGLRSRCSLASRPSHRDQFE